MVVWTIPPHIQKAIETERIKKETFAQKGTEFIKKHTGIDATDFYNCDSRLCFFVNEKTDDLPKFLKYEKDDEGIAVVCNMRSKKGKEIRQLWSQEMEEYAKRPIFLYFQHIRSGRIRVVFDTINGEKYITQAEGIDLEAEGCKEVIL